MTYVPDPAVPQHEPVDRLVPAALEPCPHCGTELRGAEIPEENRKYYGGKTHASRRIGIIINDRVDHWQCPDCGGTW